ncbi:hypothetical protein SBV1_2280003 [Verrucomicrobia bacterium]|nr:hypothetical protein SBV1_2280003 [Verrucomicrobiota bacterium]
MFYRPRRGGDVSSPQTPVLPANLVSHKLLIRPEAEADMAEQFDWYEFPC